VNSKRTALFRLRQICDDATLCPHEPPDTLSATKDAPSGAVGVVKMTSTQRMELMTKLLDLLADGGQEDCPICMEDLSHAAITPCGHIFCQGCIENWMMNETAVCPLCRGVISKASLVDVPEGGLPMEETESKVVCSLPQPC
jgi:hypothetical protein